MPDHTPYNPNGIWGSKKKKFTYEPKPRIGASSPKQKPSAEQKDSEKIYTIKHDHASGNEHATSSRPDTNLSSTPSASPAVAPRGDGEKDGDNGKLKRIIVIGVISVFVLAIAAGATYYFLKPAPAILAQVTFTQPPQITVGDPFPLVVTYTNDSPTALSTTTLSLTLPAGLSFMGEPVGQRVMQWSVGRVASGASSSVTSTIIATGNPNSVANISAALLYNPDSSGNSQAQTDATANVVIGQPAVGLTITAPSSIASGQKFMMKVNYVNNAIDALPDLRIALQLPPAFTFSASSLLADSAANDEWDVGSLAPGASGSFSVTGSIVGPDNAPYAIVGNASADFAGQSYPIASQTANLVMAPSPLQLGIALNGGQNYVAKLSDGLDYTISYVNNSNITIQNAVITAKLVGAMFDFASLRSGGTFSSITNTVTWNGANTPALQNIAPGQSGTVDITVATKGSYPIRLPSNKNYALSINGQIVSPTVPAGTAASATISVASLTNKVGGQVSFAAAGYWHDPAFSVASNTGPYPPKTDQPTEYTIHWDITNYSTDIANVTVSAYLQSGTTCTGQFASTVSGALPTCDPTTGLVSWTVPLIPATTGVISPKAEAVFQVVNTPAVNQVGGNVTLLGPTTFTAMDQFTSSTVNLSVSVIDTTLPNDTTQTNGSRQVRQ